MRREFTAISGVSMAISFLAAVVVCLQIAQVKAAPEWQISGFTAWAVELAIFGTSVYLWRNQISLAGWILGILLLVLVRLLLAAAAAVILAFQGSGDFSAALADVSTLGPRVCTAFFALMIFYPLRVVLPLRSANKPARKRLAGSAAASSVTVGVKEGDPALLLVGGDQAIPVWDARPRPATPSPPDAAPMPMIDLDGSIELPLGEVLAQVPRDCWGATAEEYAPSHPVSIPLEVIAPQLREARVLVQLRELYQWMPPGALRLVSGQGQGPEETLVLLPLELVVPRVPAEVFELPAPSPPSWARVREDETVLFATTPVN